MTQAAIAGGRFDGRIPLVGPLTLFMIGGLAGLLASYDPALSAPWLLWLVAGAALYCGVVALVRQPGALAVAAAVPTLMALLVSVALAGQYRHFGYDQKFGLVASLGALTSAPFPPLIGAFMNANATASFLEGALPLSAGLALGSGGRQRLLWAACAGLIGYATLLTASRGAWVALAAGALMGGLALARSLQRRGRPRLLLLAGVASAAAAGGLALALLSPGGARALDAALLRAEDRLSLYRNAFFLALDFPLSGIGPGATFGMTYSRFQLLIDVPFLDYAHNLFLAVWLAQGLIGLVGFCALVLGAGRLIWRGLRSTADTSTVAIRWGSAIGCAVTLLHGLTDAPQYDTCWPALLMNFALLGLAIAAARIGQRREVGWLRLGRAAAFVAALGALALAAVAGPGLLAAASANVASVLEARAGLRPRLAAAERAALHAAGERWVALALSFDPASAAALKRRGMLAMETRNYAAAVASLETALRRTPADQSLRKALGYAYVWSGRVDDGVRLFAALDRVAEVQQELRVWPFAWRERGRDDLARRSQLASASLGASLDR